MEITVFCDDISEKPAVCILRIVKGNSSTDILPINLQHCDHHQWCDNFKLHTLWYKEFILFCEGLCVVSLSWLPSQQSYFTVIKLNHNGPWRKILSGAFSCSVIYISIFITCQKCNWYRDYSADIGVMYQYITTIHTHLHTQCNLTNHQTFIHQSQISGRLIFAI
jgi:hypothetical protein